MNWSLRLIKSSVQEILYCQSLKGILAILSEMTEESYQCLIWIASVWDCTRLWHYLNLDKCDPLVWKCYRWGRCHYKSSPYRLQQSLCEVHHILVQTLRLYGPFFTETIQEIFSLEFILYFHFLYWNQSIWSLFHTFRILVFWFWFDVLRSSGSSVKQ